MKKYRVSLALKVPCNFEVKVDASSEKEALEVALGEWEDINHRDDFEDVITDPIWDELELAINLDTSLEDLGNGIHIEEIED